MSPQTWQRSIVKTLALAAALAALAGAATPARADTVIIVPGAQAAAEGNTAQNAPFYVGGASVRYQQVYGAPEFSAIDGPFYITEIRFRPDASAGNAFSSNHEVQINLSTTSQAPDGLSTTFASNVGADDTIVYGRGPLSLSSADTGGGASGPRDFDVVISLSTPFLYDSSLGNLLLDMRIYTNMYATPFDGHSENGDAVSRVWASGVNSATGSASTLGLVTQFTAQPTAIPEPAAMALFGTGLAGVAARIRWLRRRASRL